MHGSIYSCLIRKFGIVHPVDRRQLYRVGTRRSFCRQERSRGSAFDGIGIGLGFTIALTLLGAIRELLGTGKLFNLTIMPEQFGSLIFVLAPGAFIALGFLIAIVNKLRKA